MAAKTIILTKQGLEELKKELTHLLEVIRPQVIKELVDARNQGDLSENADYDAARNKQAETESRIKEIESLINRATIISDKSVNKKQKKVDITVEIGSTVTFKSTLDNVEKSVKIVGAIEADPFTNLISNESPIAKAIIGKKIGDIIEISEIKKPYKIEIKNIK